MNTMMYHEIINLLKDVDGDLIDFRVYKGYTFSYMVKLANEARRHAVGIDTFNGLPAPDRNIDLDEGRFMVYPEGFAYSSVEDVEQSINNLQGGYTNYTIHKGLVANILPKMVHRRYAYAVVDMLHYGPTETVLNYLVKRMSKGGIIHLSDYNTVRDGLATGAIKKFLEEHGDKFEVMEDYEGSVDNKVLRLKYVGATKSIAAPKKSSKADTKTPRNSDKPEVTIAMVLRSGGDTYIPKYVNALARNIAKHTTVPYKLVVLTDFSSGFDMDFVDEIIPLKHKFAGWWSKIELFRPDIYSTERVVYFDLDTVVVANIDHLLKAKSYFTGIRDLYHLSFLQTGVMFWNSKYHHHLYSEFLTNPPINIAKHNEGDAKWIRNHLYDYDYLQDKFPGTLVSFKAHCLNKSTKKITIPQGASVICFHGNPRPHTIKDSIITDHWKYE